MSITLPKQLPAPHDLYLQSGNPQVVGAWPLNPEHGAVYITPTMVGRESERWKAMPVEARIGQLDRRIDLLQDVGKVASVHIDSLKEELTTDSLTGLKNRRAFMTSLLEHVSEKQGHFAISFVDLDRFKQVNDTQGHAAGDSLLVMIADRAQKEVHVREGDEIFRLGGDEFAVLIGTQSTGNDRRKQRPEGETIAGFEKRIVAEVEQAAQECGAPFVSASIGTARHLLGETAEQLLARVDEAMYADKRARKVVA